MDVSQFPARCPECGELFGFDVWGCLLCGRFLCRRHLTFRKGVANCSDCEGERRERERLSGVTDADEERVVALITRDLLATAVVGCEHFAIEEGARLRMFSDGVPEYEQRVVDDVQQRMHDEFVNTTWPTCPHHPNHPLWYSDGWWRCRVDGPIARLGELAESE